MSMLAPDQIKPVMRPYLAAVQNFSSGKQTPREFLEESLDLLEQWEPRIGAFVCTNVPAARAAADRATARWRAGKPLSAIDGMPVGIKDIIETVDMPTEMGSPLFAGWRSQKDAASVRALRDAGAVIIGKTVTTEFAASEPRGTRNPWNTAHTPGGSSSGSAASVAAGIVSAALGTQVISSTVRPASYCGCVGFKPTVNALNRQGSHDYQSQSCTGILGASLEDTWQVAYEIVARVGGDAGTPGLRGPDKAPAAKKPRALAMLETAGWDVASAGAKANLEDCLTRLKSAGVDIRTRHNDKKVAALEAELPQVTELSHRCNGWENRWFLHTMRDRDASKLSRLFVERAEKYESLTLDQHRADLKERARIRAVHAELAAVCDACITLAAPSAAPEGLSSTGNPEFGVPSSLLGVPSLSLPLFEVDAMPLGLQVIGYFDRDADAFAIASWLMQAR
jgi:Asp-tRNA(Asn)/Glu-tRNA(Gln) amidotransferase A subunit family amidase